MYIPSGLSSLYLMGRFAVVILIVGLVLAMGGSGADMPEQMVTFAFTDGDISVIETAHPILSRYDYRGDVYVATNSIGSPGKLTEEDLLDLYEAGWGVGSHGLVYQDLALLSDEEVLEQLQESKQILSEIVPEVYGFYLTHDNYTNHTLDLIAEVYPATVISYWKAVNEIPMNAGDQHRVMALDINNLALNGVKAIINLMEEDQWIMLSLTGVGRNHNWSEEDFTELVDYIAEKDFVAVNRPDAE